MSTTDAKHPLHTGQPLLTAGATLAGASGAMVLLHGRGGSPQDVLRLGEAIAPAGFALLAPQASGHTWYPNSFLAPRAQNEPWLSSALETVGQIDRMAQAAGVPTDRIVIAGFSQGACLTSEYVGRHPRRFGAALVFTGGLIGPLDEEITLSGDLAGTPVLLSSGDPDAHVPWARVLQTAELLRGIGGQVTARRHVGRPHTVAVEEIAEARSLLAKLL